jgi:hypothetical protein
VMVYRDQPGAADLDTTGMSLVVDGADVALYRVPGADLDHGTEHGRATIAVVVAADALWAIAGLVAIVGVGVVAVRRRRRARGD